MTLLRWQVNACSGWGGEMVMRLRNTLGAKAHARVIAGHCDETCRIGGPEDVHDAPEVPGQCPLWMGGGMGGEIFP